MTIAAQRVARNTGGGDAPGLNGVIHGAVYAARGLGWLGAAAIHALSMVMDGVMVALNPPRIDFVPIQQAIAKLKLVPPDVAQARSNL